MEFVVLLNSLFVFLVAFCSHRYVCVYNTTFTDPNFKNLHDSSVLKGPQLWRWALITSHVASIEAMIIYINILNEHVLKHAGLLILGSYWLYVLRLQDIVMFQIFAVYRLILVHMETSDSVKSYMEMILEDTCGLIQWAISIKQCPT